MTASTLVTLAANPIIFQTYCSSQIGIWSSFFFRQIIRSSSFRNNFLLKIILH
jgi:hypothetical protein